MVDIVAKFEEIFFLDNNVSENNLVTSTTFESKVVILLVFICLNKTLTFRGVFEPKMIISGSQFYFSVSLTNDYSKHLVRLIL